MAHLIEATTENYTTRRDVTHGLGPDPIDYYVARRPWQPFAVARGRRSVIVSAEMVEGMVTGELPVDQATALLAHAATSAEAGHCRQDPLIAFWTLPWRILVRLTRPFQRIFRALWAFRPIVVGIAVLQSNLPRPTTLGILTAAGLTALLALTYLAPRWVRSWDQYVLDQADRAVAARGLGGDLASFLRRLRPSIAMAERIRRLEAIEPENGSQRPHLQLVTGQAQ